VQIPGAELHARGGTEAGNGRGGTSVDAAGGTGLGSGDTLNPRAAIFRQVIVGIVSRLRRDNRSRGEFAKDTSRESGEWKKRDHVAPSAKRAQIPACAIEWKCKSDWNCDCAG